MMVHTTFAHFCNIFSMSKFGANPISSSDFSATTIVTDGVLTNIKIILLIAYTSNLPQNPDHR